MTEQEKKENNQRMKEFIDWCAPGEVAIREAMERVKKREEEKDAE